MKLQENLKGISKFNFNIWTFSIQSWNSDHNVREKWAKSLKECVNWWVDPWQQIRLVLELRRTLDNNALNFSFGMYHHVSRFLLKVHQATQQCHDISHYLNQSLEKMQCTLLADGPNQPWSCLPSKPIKKELLRPQKKSSWLHLRVVQLSRKLQSVMKDWIVLSLHLLFVFLYHLFQLFSVWQKSWAY